MMDPLDYVLITVCLPVLNYWTSQDQSNGGKHMKNNELFNDTVNLTDITVMDCRLL